MNNAKEGSAPCAKCGAVNLVDLDGYVEPCTHCHGLNYRCAPLQFCACGEPLRWLHQPGNIDVLAFPVYVAVAKEHANG